MEFNSKIYDDMLSEILAEITKNLESIYFDTVWDLSYCVGNLSIKNGKWTLGDYPHLTEQVEGIIAELNANALRVITSGIASSWALSNVKNDRLVELFFKGKIDHLSDKLLERYQQANLGALSSFIDRKTNGMSLSDRVWHYNDFFKKEMETALHIGIGNGVSSKKMADYMVKYLRNPSATQLEVDEKGIAKEIPIPKQGAGIYRDPKANAMRLARTETNMAYRTADQTRWKQLDFVVGYEVHLSHNHTTMKNGKRVRFVDMCDFLEGKYPKDFKFVGWHPQCRCYTTPILSTDAEFVANERAFLYGEDVPNKQSVNTVTDAPKNFYDWVSENRERLSHSKSLPYFVRDNKDYFKSITFSKSVSSQFRESK